MMQRKALGIVFLCLVLLVAIVLGYWDMLSSEKLRISQAEDSAASQPVTIARNDTAQEQPAPTQPAATDADDAENGTSPAVSPDRTASSPTATARIVPDAANADPQPEVSAEVETAARTAPTGQPAEGESASAMPRSSASEGEQAPDASVSNDGGMQTDVTERSAEAQRPNEAETPERDMAASVADKAATVDAPLFDLLRVEPDGSTLIAGRSAPGSRITLHDGEKTIGDDTANAAGEFVLVLPEPLQPGDHAIKIIATTPDGATATSRETAVVSVPRTGRDGDLLAMVEAPDRPSRLINVPTPRPDQAAAPHGPAAGAKNADDSAPLRAGPQDTVSSDEPANEPGGTGHVETAMLPKASDEAGTGEPAGPATSPILRIEAVEVEGGKMFVAGAADSGTSVRVYLDNSLLAEDRTGADDRFLVTAERQVAVGDHFVRADQVNAEGEVTARAEVPFTRPQGEAVAAIAPPSDEVATGLDAANTAAPMATTAGPKPLEQSDDVASAKTSPTDAPQAAAGTNIATTAPTSAPTRAEAGTPPAEASDGGETRSAALSPADSPVAMQKADRAPDSEASVDEPVAEPGIFADRAERTEAAEIAASDAPRQDAEVPAPASEPVVTQGSAMSGEADSPPAASTERRFVLQEEVTVPGGDTVPINRQAPLATAAGRVIIRKGDTLWGISRQTYGLGSRYTVIYFANGNRIRDPDLIYPGQVFRLPSAQDDTREADAVEPGQLD